MTDKTAMINLKVFEKKTLDAMTRVEREQFPYALAKTLNILAYKSVTRVQRVTRRRFKLHSDFIPRGIGQIPGTLKMKSEIRNSGIGETVVFTKKLISQFMPIHEEGGTRTPTAATGRTSGGKDRGKAITLPSKDLDESEYKTGSGKVKKAMHPRTLLKDYVKGNRKALVRRGRKSAYNKAFVIEGRKSNVPIIVRRLTPKAYPLEILYVMSRRAGYNPKWRFEETIERIVVPNFPHEFKKQLKLAVDS